MITAAIPLWTLQGHPDLCYTAVMKLQQGQTWKRGDAYFRIVEWARLSITYKVMKDLSSGEGTMHTVTKKEFCRLIKTAELYAEESP